MQWPFRRQSNPIENYPLPTDLNGPVETPGVTTHTTGMSRGAQITTIVIASVVLIVVVGLLGHWIYTTATKNTSTHKPQVATASPSSNSTKGLPVTANPNSSQRIDNAPSTPSASPSTPSNPPAAKPQPKPSTAPTTPTTKSPSTSATPQQNLANTGPGSLIAVFVTTTAVAFLGYQLALRRRTV